MKVRHLNLAGALVFIGAAEFLIFMMVSEAIYPDYSIAHDAISALGVGLTSYIFNLSIILFGALIIVASYLIEKSTKDKLMSTFLFLFGIGTCSVGIFPGTVRFEHMVAAMTAFVFGGLSAIASYRATKPPFSYISIMLGIVSLFSLFVAPFFHIASVIGSGGAERMVVYPILVWALGFGAYLMSRAEAIG
ncbi:MAG: DUF998 domain-containing protein [Candidatus Micrarchaeota archaeon]|nr:DUF998 domain-containing protein [Candidatus Micrarchaeota archaeon]